MNVARSEEKPCFGRIHSTESFGTVDGPGIRFVIFMQGCPMRCLYCHNPDTWEIEGGTLKTAEELLKEYDSYKEFLKGGGLTVTGGEPLMQIDFVLDLFEKAKKKSIHTCLDSAGILFPWEAYRKNTKNNPILEKYQKLLAVTDLVMLDIKHIDDEEHKKLTGHSNKAVLVFADFLAEHKVKLWVRHVVVPGITDKPEMLDRLGYYLGGLRSLSGLDVLPYHTMGEAKYKAAEIPYPLAGVPPLNKEEALAARALILEGLKRRLQE